MHKSNYPPRRERQIRFAEAGVLFVLLLGVAIFVGVRFQGDDGEIATAEETPTVVEAVVETAEITGDEAATTVVVEPEPMPEPEPEPVTYAQAETAYHAGTYDEAVDLFERYLSDHPDNVWGLYMLGLSAWKADDLETADLAFTDARELDPEHLKSLVNHARVLLDLDRDVDAQTAVTAALDLDPEDAGTRRLQARIHHRQGRLEEAAAAYNGILRTDDGDVWALNNLGLIRVEQERFAEALAPLARAAELNAAACIRNNLGVALERTGHYTAAAAAYEGALELDADHARAEVSLARVSGLQEDPELVPVDLAALAASFRVEAVLDAENEIAANELTVPVPLEAVPEEFTTEEVPDAPESTEEDEDSGIR